MALPFPKPATLDSSFSMSRPTEADIDALSRVYFESFADDPGNTYWWSPDHEAMAEWLRARVEGKMRNRRVRHFQVVDNDASGELVAFARWDVPDGYEAAFGEFLGEGGDVVDVDVSRVVMEEQDEKNEMGTGTAADVEEVVPAAVKTMVPPRGADVECFRAFFGALAALSKKWNAEEMLGLSLLCTSPKYRRRGAAKALLTPVLAVADAQGLRSYVEATPAGRPLYEKLGYRVVEEKVYDITAMTGGRVTGETSLTIMIREPQKSSS